MGRKGLIEEHLDACVGRRPRSVVQREHAVDLGRLAAGIKEAAPCLQCLSWVESVDPVSAAAAKREAVVDHHRLTLLQGETLTPPHTCPA